MRNMAVYHTHMLTYMRLHESIQCLRERFDNIECFAVHQREIWFTMRAHLASKSGHISQDFKLQITSDELYEPHGPHG